MLTLVKKGKMLSKEEMSSLKGGWGNCGTIVCGCGTIGNDQQMNNDYWKWYWVPVW